MRALINTGERSNGPSANLWSFSLCKLSSLSYSDLLILVASISLDPQLHLLDSGNLSPYTTTWKLLSLFLTKVVYKWFPTLWWFDLQVFDFIMVQKWDIFGRSQLLSSLIRREKLMTLLLSHPHHLAIHFCSMLQTFVRPSVLSAVYVNGTYNHSLSPELKCFASNKLRKKF